MTNDVDRDNDDWLQGLAGEPRPEADKFTNAQAEALRNAFVRRGKEVENNLPDTSEAAFHRLLFRLKKEGYIGPEADKKRVARERAANDAEAAHSKTGTFDGVMFRRGIGRPSEIITPAKTVRSWINPALGLAAVFVIGAALIFYMEVGRNKEEDPFALRGGEAVVLIVADQNEKVMQLVDALNPLGGEVKITREADGSVTLIVKATEPVVERLMKDRIQPEVKSGYIRISVVPKK